MADGLSGGAVAGIVVGGYIVLSILVVRLMPFRRWSNGAIIEGLKERFPYSLRHSSHRGGSLTAPENTLLAFDVATRLGKTDLLEMDVNISADGVPVVSHDASLERICDAAETDLVAHLVVGSDPDASLPCLRRQIRLHFPSVTRGTYYDADVTAAVSVPHAPCRLTRLCLLSEVFDAFPTTPIHLDIKAPSRLLTEKVVAMVEQYKREHITILGSARDNSAHLKKLLRQPWRSSCQTTSDSGTPLLQPNRAGARRPHFRTFASFQDVVRVYVLFYLGLLPFVPLDFDVLSIPLITDVKVGLFGALVGARKALIAQFLLTSPVLWRHLQRRGVAVIGWVLNDENEFHQAAQWPVNGLMTDDPLALRKFFDEQQQSNMLTW